MNRNRREVVAVAECIISIQDAPDGSINLEWVWDGPVPKDDKQTNAQKLALYTITMMVAQTNATVDRS